MIVVYGATPGDDAEIHGCYRTVKPASSGICAPVM